VLPGFAGWPPVAALSFTTVLASRADTGGAGFGEAAGCAMSDVTALGASRACCCESGVGVGGGPAVGGAASGCSFGSLCAVPSIMAMVMRPLIAEVPRTVSELAVYGATLSFCLPVDAAGRLGSTRSGSR